MISITWLHGAVLDKVLGLSLRKKYPSFNQVQKFIAVLTKSHYCVWFKASAAMYMRSALFWHGVQLSANSLPTFRDKLSVSSSRVKKSKKISWPLKMGPICCSETSVQTNSLPTFRYRISTLRCVISRKSADLSPLLVHILHLINRVYIVTALSLKQISKLSPHLHLCHPTFMFSC
jgi:hypothetical protein